VAIAGKVADDPVGDGDHGNTCECSGRC
jgi:hypothetical protein